MEERMKIVLIALFVFAILFFAFRDNSIVGKVIDSSSAIPSGICKDCNVVLISIDTLRADHLPCYGYEKNTAPNICALAKDSIFFKEPYSVSAWTYPSHYSMLTGLYPRSHGILYQSQTQPFDPETDTIQKILNANSYESAAFTNGGWVNRASGFGSNFGMFVQSLGIHDKFETNQDRISRWFDGYTQKENFFLFLHGYDAHVPYDKVSLDLRFKFYVNGSVSDKCYAELEKLDENVSLCMNDVTLNEKKAYTNSQYDAAIYGADEYVGQLISELKVRGLYDNTIIIITSDHGERFGERGKWDHVDTLYQELIDVPLIIRIPGVEGKEVDTPVSNLDIAPTILDLLGVENNYNMDGKSLLPIINGGEGRPIYAVTEGKVWETNNPEKNTGIWFAMINNSLKIIVSEDKGIVTKELYNLKYDPREQKNLFDDARYAERFGEMNSQILDWINGLGLESNRNIQSTSNLDPRLTEQLKSLGYLN